MDEASQLYTAFRAYLSHEDDLIHQRTTWSITIQSFVIATFGFTFQKQMEIVAKQSEPASSSLKAELSNVLAQYDHFLVALAVFGLTVAVISGAAVYAAQSAITRLVTLWQGHHDREPCCRRFPLLTGGGSRIAHVLGHSLPLALPLFFVLFWLTTAVYVAFDGATPLARLGTWLAAIW